MTGLISKLTAPTSPMEAMLFHAMMDAPTGPMKVMFFYYHSVRFDPQIDCILTACNF